ncbi:MAG: bifunctional DNA primase/polymerase [Terriglobales bacterium]
MSQFLESAQSNAARGWHVFPLNGKHPRISKAAGGNGFKDATLDLEQITGWWTKYPTANIGIACGASDQYVVDIDHGLNSEEDFHAWRMRNNVPMTYTVRSGGRPEFRVQMYYTGAVECNGKWELDGCKGEIRSIGGYVCAAGSIHPDTGEAYQLLVEAPLAPRPSVIEQAVKQAEQIALTPRQPGEKILENRNMELTSMIGRLRERMVPRPSLEAALAYALQWNQDECASPMDESEVEDTVTSLYRRYADPAIVPEVIFGSSQPKPVTNWRERYHSFEEMDNAPEPTFLIEGFLQKDVISSIAAPVGQRKTIIAANVVHAVLTGERLFDHFAVVQRPARVLYLCPEMGLLSFTKRMRNLGLMQYVGKTLFCRTMNSEGKLLLSEMMPEELAGALVVVDTAVRFIEGDENSSEDMKVFAEDCFKLMKNGAASVLVLFHSPKGTKEASELTLENAMRGSGDLGAFVSSCWATRLQDPDAPWESASYLKNVKQRDFESDPFEVKSDKLGRLHIVTAPGSNVVLNGKKKGTVGNADGREEEALQVIRDNPTLSHKKIVLKLAERGIERSSSWVGNKKFDLFNVGVKSSA